MFLLSFLLILGALGAAISVGRGLIPSMGGLASWLVNLIGGAGAGLILGAILWLLWRGIAMALDNDTAEDWLLNCLIAGVVGTGMGGILAIAGGLVLGTGVVVRIVQGIVLGAGLLLGLRVGYALDRPIIERRRGAAGSMGRLRRRGQIASKVLDTSVIIDGRIGDLIRTGFLDGDILVPEFVLSELQNIADSSNNLRRRKGRRGLEVLRELMQDDGVSIRVVSTDYPYIKEVDRKLIHLVKDQGERGALVTTDYNLNRVAQVEGVQILNINELANAVKPRFIPGEEIAVEVIDRGEEIGQGVGYLDDGTMVVVENGRRHIGRKIKAMVKSTLQTEAGRMLFVEPVGEGARWEK